MTLMIFFFPTGCEWQEQPTLPESVQTGPTKPSLQQTTVLPVHAAGGGDIFPALLYSIRSLLCHGERGWLPLFRPTNVCCHHSNILGHCCKCSGKSGNRSKQIKNSTVDWESQHTIMLTIHVSLCRLDLTHTTGQLSITSSYGGACLSTLPFYLQCKVMAYLASFQVVSHSLVSFAQCETCEKKILMHGNWSLINLGLCVLRNGPQLSIREECVVGYSAHHSGVCCPRRSSQLSESEPFPTSNRQGRTPFNH